MSDVWWDVESDGISSLSLPILFLFLFYTVCVNVWCLVGYGIWRYQFLIFAYSIFILVLYCILRKRLMFGGMWNLTVSVPYLCLFYFYSFYTVYCVNVWCLVGCGIWRYQFLIFAYSIFILVLYCILRKRLMFGGMWNLTVSVPYLCLFYFYSSFIPYTA